MHGKCVRQMRTAAAAIEDEDRYGYRITFLTDTVINSGCETAAWCETYPLYTHTISYMHAEMMTDNTMMIIYIIMHELLTNLGKTLFP